MEYVGAEWSSERITRRPFLSLCSVNFTDWAIAAGIISSEDSIQTMCLVRVISLGFTLHPFDAFDKFFMHHVFRLVPAPAVAGQHPLEAQIQQTFHRFCLFGPRVPCHVAE